MFQYFLELATRYPPILLGPSDAAFVVNPFGMAHHDPTPPPCISLTYVIIFMHMSTRMPYHIPVCISMFMCLLKYICAIIYAGMQVGVFFVLIG